MNVTNLVPTARRRLVRERVCVCVCVCVCCLALPCFVFCLCVCRLSFTVVSPLEMDGLVGCGESVDRMCSRLCPSPAHIQNTNTFFFSHINIIQQELVQSEDPQCSVRRPFMLVVNQTLGLQALGGLISQPLLDHNITNFRAMGGK